MNRLKVVFIKFSNKQYGGQIYEQMAAEALRGNSDVQVINVALQAKAQPRFVKYLKAPAVLFRLFKSSGVRCNISIRNASIPFFRAKPPAVNIGLFYHDYSEDGPLLLRWFFKIFSDPSKFDRLVVISRSWLEHLTSKGFRNVHLIYNGYNLKEFDFTETEVLDFKERFGFDSKPIVYIGNSSSNKGAIETYNALKDLDIRMVTTGAIALDLPVRNLDLEYKDYLLLLKASHLVITMSKFNEGWCRTAHEAMLCGTPVIGSGRGGMGELLRDGKQLVCADFSGLEPMVSSILSDEVTRNNMADAGYHYARVFSTERFESDWNKMIADILTQEELTR